MKRKYYINTQTQHKAFHEIHQENCTLLSNSRTGLYLGEFSSCEAAIVAAEKLRYEAEGCEVCLPRCYQANSDKHVQYEGKS